MHARPAPVRRLSAAIAALVIVAAGLVLTASPAAAAICDDTTSDIAVGINSDPGSTTSLRVVNGTLFLDGDFCGAATSVTVFDFEPDASANKVIVIDASEPWGGVVLNLFLEIEGDPSATPTGATYNVILVTGDGSETVTMVPDEFGRSNLLVQDGGTNQLNANIVNDPINWDFRLGDGDDSLDLRDERFINSLTVVGNEGDDTILGTSRADNLRGGKGNDNIRGRGGDDVIRGQSGQDILRGGGGNDDVRGGSAADEVYGNSGADNLRGNSGNDRIRGGGGPDSIHGGKGQDNIKGNSGNDTFDTADRFVDVVSGGPGNDTCDECDATDIVRASVENR